MTSIAVIGAGVSGLILAGELAGKARVVVFEKARGVGGRLATRYAGPHEFDHGAQYFTVRSASMKGFLAPWLAAGTVAEWRPRVMTLTADQKPYRRDWFEPHYVAVPRMNQWCKELAGDKEVRLGTGIVSIAGSAGRWRLVDALGSIHGPFDWVVTTTPAAQAAHLLPGEFDGTEQIKAVGMLPCFTLMVGLTGPPLPNWEAAVVRSSVLGWIAVNGSKPGRADRWSLVAHSSNEWARDHVGLSREQALEPLVEALQRTCGIDVSKAASVACHRWLYAYADRPAARTCFIDDSMQLGACGDWCLGSRVEAALDSAMALARALGQRLTPP
jgi:renalase